MLAGSLQSAHLPAVKTRLLRPHRPQAAAVQVLPLVLVLMQRLAWVAAALTLRKPHMKTPGH